MYWAHLLEALEIVSPLLFLRDLWRLVAPHCLFPMTMELRTIAKQVFQIAPRSTGRRFGRRSNQQARCQSAKR